MNTYQTELLSELNRQKIINEMKAIRLETVVNVQPSWIDQGLLQLGDWMIAHGEKLRRQYVSSTTQTSQLYHLRDASLNLEHKK